MNSTPTARLTVITLGVTDMKRSIAFYSALGFKRKMNLTGDEVAFFETGATALALFSWASLAEDAGIKAEPPPKAFRGVTLAWNCSSRDEVDAALAHALEKGGRLLKDVHATSYGGYCGFFLDPDDHLWEVVVAPGIDLMSDGRVSLPD